MTPHHWERILWTTKDRVLHSRNHRWAYVLVFAPVRADGPAGQEESVRALRSFIAALYPALIVNNP